LIARRKQEAKRSAAGTCCPLVPLGAPLKLIIGSLFFQAESEHIMQRSFIQMGQAVGPKINQKIKSFKGGHFYRSIGGQIS